MGREWYFNWGSKSSSKKGGGTTKGGGGGGGGSGGDGGGGGGEGGQKRSGMPQVATAAAAVAASGGCMNAVLHMFDFHHFHLCLHTNNRSYLPDDPAPLKGVEAPRNSLESIKEDEKDNSLNNPVDVQIKTNRRDTRLELVQAPRVKVEDTLSQSSCSPTSARTPTLVARLMGLDILPESNNTTPRSSHSTQITYSTPPRRTTRTRTPTSSSNNNEVLGPRSRAETPNSSSSSSSSQRRRSTDVVDHHRLSLQINKENSIVKEMESSRPSCSAINTKRREGRKYYEEENKSPGYYAKQIMKQVKETVSRRVGADITNTIAQRELRRDEYLLSTTLPTTSPKLIKSSETSKKLSENLSDVQEMVYKLQLKPVRRENEKKMKYGNDCFEKSNIDLKKLGGTKQSSKMTPKSCDSIRSKKDEQFVHPSTRANSLSTDKKCKKTPLSSELVHASLPSIIPLKKDSSSSQHPPKLLEIQEGLSKAEESKLINNKSTTMHTTTRLSSGPSQRTREKVQEEATHKPANHEKKDGTGASTSTSIAECQYISRILKCTGIDRDTPVSFTRWFSPSHPLDPAIFHTLEAAHYLITTTNPNHSSSSDINISLSINRKLIFHLVDEILADILKQDIKIKPYNHCHSPKQIQINGFQLVKTLCTKIRTFPSTDCKTLQDIDALVEKDMPKLGTMGNLEAFEEEGEDIVSEIEGDILESLVQEMALFCFESRISSSMQRYVSW